MKFLSYASSGKPYCVGGIKQFLRCERRSGKTTARQQKKAAKAHRREMKLAA